MRLDPESLNVESFATGTESDIATTVITFDTGKGGPDSLCYICYNTGNFVPSCKDYECAPDTGKGGPDSLCYICYETGRTMCYAC